MTIYEIKQRTLETSPYFFDRKTLKFFGQTLRDFSVIKVNDELYQISAPIFHNNVQVGRTVRYFDTKTNELKREASKS